MSSLRFLITIPLVAIGACAENVDPEPLGDYTAWPSMGGSMHTVQGRAPGHGDTIRVIYVNPTAATAERISPSYPMGSTIVKEIRQNLDGVAGDINYIAIMRRQDTDVDEGLENEGGWLFSEQRPANAPEIHRDLCWARCHVAAPYNGAFYDYRVR
jgi:hypothetical protein